MNVVTLLLILRRLPADWMVSANSVGDFTVHDGIGEYRGYIDVKSGAYYNLTKELL